MRFSYGLFAVLAAFMGCASPRPEVERLQAVSQTQTVVIQTTLSRVIADGKIEQGLLPGTYQAIAENEVGVFYKGPQRAFYERTLPNGLVNLRLGGFWLPKSPGATPRLFYEFEPDSHTAANLDVALQGMQNPTTGIIGGLPVSPGANIVGGALAGALVSSIIESGRGERFLLGTFPGDPIPAALHALPIARK